MQDSYFLIGGYHGNKDLIEAQTFIVDSLLIKENIVLNFIPHPSIQAILDIFIDNNISINSVAYVPIQTDKLGATLKAKTFGAYRNPSLDYIMNKGYTNQYYGDIKTIDRSDLNSPELLDYSNLYYFSDMLKKPNKINRLDIMSVYNIIKGLNDSKYVILVGDGKRYDGIRYDHDGEKEYNRIASIMINNDMNWKLIKRVGIVEIYMKEESGVGE